MAWPDTPTVERSRARWVSQYLIRRGLSVMGTDRPHAVVPLTDMACPVCAGPTVADVARMDALFFHGGYGATMRTTRRRCPVCGWALVSEITEECPPR